MGNHFLFEDFRVEVRLEVGDSEGLPDLALRDGETVDSFAFRDDGTPDDVVGHVMVTGNTQPSLQMTLAELEAGVLQGSRSAAPTSNASILLRNTPKAFRYR